MNDSLLMSRYCLFIFLLIIIIMPAQRLTFQEKIEIIKIVGDNVRSSREAAREFNRRNPNRRPPLNDSTVRKIIKCFNDTGSVSETNSRGSGHQRQLNDLAILAYFDENPRSSLRNAAINLNKSRNTIWRCLKNHNRKPYKPKFLHTLQVGDEERRFEYCLWAQGEYLNDPDLKKKSSIAMRLHSPQTVWFPHRIVDFGQRKIPIG